MIGALPAGRFRVAALVARTRPDPFVARMTATLGGALFCCDLGDAIARDVCLIGAYEPQVTQVFTRLLRPGATVVDLGANWGYFTLIAARQIGPTGRVFAFEPDPRMFDLLQTNVRLNGFGWVEALPLAAGADRETRTLAGYGDDADNRGVSRICDGLSPDGRTTFAVNTTPVDWLLDHRGVETVDMIKIDVEGFEDAVLAGIGAGLAQHRYRHVLIELHPELLAERGVTADRCCDRLRAAGYAGWAFDHSPSAIRRAARSRSLPLSALLARTDGVPSADPWPHMLWTATDTVLTDEGPGRA